MAFNVTARLHGALTGCDDARREILELLARVRAVPILRECEFPLRVALLLLHYAGRVLAGVYSAWVVKT